MCDTKIFLSGTSSFNHPDLLLTLRALLRLLRRDCRRILPYWANPAAGPDCFPWTETLCFVGTGFDVDFNEMSLTSSGMTANVFCVADTAAAQTAVTELAISTLKNCLLFISFILLILSMASCNI